jgi:uncharacterized membrane protein (DUF4010 family)
LRQALIFVAIVGLALLLAAALRNQYGDSGVMAALAAAGFADVHAAAVSLAQMFNGSALPEGHAVWALVGAFSTNSLVKCLVALPAGRRFAVPVVIGVVGINVAAVVGAWLSAF